MCLENHRGNDYMEALLQLQLLYARELMLSERMMWQQRLMLYAWQRNYTNNKDI